MIQTPVIKAVFVLAIAGEPVAAQIHATAQMTPTLIPGVVVEASVTPVRWLGLVPTRAVRFELTISVDRRVSPFSAIKYECHFLSPSGYEIGLASRGVAGREAFAAENGQLISRAHEELPDNGKADIHCRATEIHR